MQITELDGCLDISFLHEIRTPIDALIARGFLFEPLGNNQYKYCFVGDQAAYAGGKRTDYDDLCDICNTFQFGSFDNHSGVLTINDNDIDLRPVLFTHDRRSFAVCEWDPGFDYFIEHPGLWNCVGVLELEPFIARYIKTLHFCDIPTDFSCDDYAFHWSKRTGKKFGQITIKAMGLLWKEWHKWIVKTYVEPTVALEWDPSYTSIQFERKDISDIYEKLQQAAMLIFSNKKEIQKIYDEALLSDELDDLDDIAAVEKMMMIADTIKASIA